MVMPLGDDDLDRRSVPVVTYILIAINVIVWLLELSGGERFINGYSAIPFEITHNTDLVGSQAVDVGGQSISIPMYPGPTPIYLTLLTSMFMHASWMHIIGNMLYLWIFGDNIEDRLGRVKFLVHPGAGRIRRDRRSTRRISHSLSEEERASSVCASDREHARVHRARIVDSTPDIQPDRSERRSIVWRRISRAHRRIHGRRDPDLPVRRPSKARRRCMKAKTVGIVGGIGPEATIDYYRMLLAAFKERGVDDYRSVLINSIAANTAHIVFDEIQALSTIPLVSIVVAACDAAKEMNLHRVGLLGTKFTMQGTFFPEHFDKHGIEIVVPDAADMEYVHTKYLGELVPGVFLDETRAGIIAVLDRLRQKQKIDGVILAGTELPLLLRGVEYDLPLLDTARIHIDAVVRRAIEP
jgi:aspartate racemase